MSIANPVRVDEKLRAVALDALASPGIPDAASDPALAKLTEIGTQLWLDTGNLDEAKGLWHKEFTALTTNNTLANQVVQTGILDDVAKEAVADIRAAQPDITDDQLILELGFVVNCHIALRLVKAFNVMVSVELHPAVSEDIESTVRFAERYYAICPEKFIIKIPLTPEGYCAVAQVRAKNIPVNYTLGFSARQNYLAAVLSNPSYCNVFLGRLNAVISDNRMGDGKYVGEKVTLATQTALRELRAAGRTGTHLIAASMRSAAQAHALAGVDVYTIPPKVAKEFLDSKPNPADITSQIDTKYDVTLLDGVDKQAVEVLWTVDDAVRKLADDLAARGGVHLTGDDLREADADHKAGLFHRFNSSDTLEIREQGKIPNVDRWKHDKGIALDNLMTQSALQSFVTDQGALDDHLRQLVLTV